MAIPPFDSDSVLAELRAMSRGSLLVIAERAAELIPADQLSVLLGDFVKLEVTSRKPVQSSPALLDDIREFINAAMTGHYYEAVEINNRGRQEQSAGTDAFVAEFDRLVRRCALAPELGQFAATRESVELLLDLLRHIDGGNDDVLFFADDGGSVNVGVNWKTVLPAYFKSVAVSMSPSEFAYTVVSTIGEFAPYDCTRHLAAAHIVADDAQRIALEALVSTGI